MPIERIVGRPSRDGPVSLYVQRDGFHCYSPSRLGTRDGNSVAPIGLTPPRGTAFPKSVPECIFPKLSREDGETGKPQPPRRRVSEARSAS